MFFSVQDSGPDTGRAGTAADIGYLQSIYQGINTLKVLFS